MGRGAGTPRASRRCISFHVQASSVAVKSQSRSNHIRFQGENKRYRLPQMGGAMSVDAWLGSRRFNPLGPGTASASTALWTVFKFVIHDLAFLETFVFRFADRRGMKEHVIARAGDESEAAIPHKSLDGSLRHYDTFLSSD